MFLQRSAVAVARRAVTTSSPVLRRSIATTLVRRDENHRPLEKMELVQKLKDIKTIDDLVGPGAKPGTVPTDLEQATGIERLEILGKMENIDIFDMRPLDSSRVGTLDNPIIVRSAGDEQYAGCTGCPADSHVVHWLGMSRTRPVERCPECGSVYKMEYIGPVASHDDHGHGHDHHGYEEPKTFADYVKPEYHW